MTGPAPDPEADLVDRLAGTSPGPGEADLSVEALEALLFVAERPLGRREIARLAGVDRATVDERLGDLEVGLRSRGIRLLVAGDEVELATAPEAGPLVARYLGVGAARLSVAGLETLAIVAYRQPVTRAAIERVRGVDSEYILRSLLHRRLVVEQGRADAPGRPILYGTSFGFLERFGLAGLDDLPPLEAEVAARLVDAELAEQSGVVEESDRFAQSALAGSSEQADREQPVPLDASPGP
ncbi:MAG TPA: SMC-Scp complex subunit ScpB [Candidatus Limnocylindrales bacterium]|nr:SMC-Scp complex subunit ScpB [Candidatus Limnocylindrales bacterium]